MTFFKTNAILLKCKLLCCFCIFTKKKIRLQVAVLMISKCMKCFPFCFIEFLGIPIIKDEFRKRKKPQHCICSYFLKIQCWALQKFPWYFDFTIYNWWRIRLPKSDYPESAEKWVKASSTRIFFIFCQILGIFDAFFSFTAPTARSNLKNHQIWQLFLEKWRKTLLFILL